MMDGTSLKNDIMKNFGLHDAPQIAPVGDSDGHFLVRYNGRTAIATAKGQKFIDFYDSIAYYGNVLYVGEMFLCGKKHNPIIENGKMISDSFFEYDMRRVSDGREFMKRNESEFLLPWVEDGCRALLAVDSQKKRWGFADKEGKLTQNFNFVEVLKEFYMPQIGSEQEMLEHLEEVPEWLVDSCYESWCDYYAGSIARILKGLDGRKRLQIVARYFDDCGLNTLKDLLCNNGFLCEQISSRLINYDRELIVNNFTMKQALKESLCKTLQEMDIEDVDGRGSQWVAE